MIKKIISVLLCAVMLASLMIPVFAEDGDSAGNAILSTVTDFLKGFLPDDIDFENFDFQQLLNSQTVQDLIAQITADEGVVDITNIVIDLVASLNAESIKQKGQAEFTAIIAKLVSVLTSAIMQVYNNKDLIFVYDLDVIRNFFGYGEYLKGDDDNTPTFGEDYFGGLADLNDDGRINAMDARMILRNSANLLEFTDEQIIRADVDLDGEITAKDARLVLRYSAGLVPAADVPAFAAVM